LVSSAAAVCAEHQHDLNNRIAHLAGGLRRPPEPQKPVGESPVMPYLIGPVLGSAGLTCPRESGLAFWDGRRERETTVKSWNRVFRKLSDTADPPIVGHPYRFRDTFAVSLPGSQRRFTRPPTTGSEPHLPVARPAERDDAQDIPRIAPDEDHVAGFH